MTKRLRGILEIIIIFICMKNLSQVYAVGRDYLDQWSNAFLVHKRDPERLSVLLKVTQLVSLVDL